VRDSIKNKIINNKEREREFFTNNKDILKGNLNNLKKVFFR